MFVYELSDPDFQSKYSNLIVIFRVCIKQEDPRHSGNFSVLIQSEKRRLHDKNIHSNETYR